MSDVLICLLLVGGVLVSSALVVWVFTAEDRAAMKAQQAELEVLCARKAAKENQR